MVPRIVAVVFIAFLAGCSSQKKSQTSPLPPVRESSTSAQPPANAQNPLYKFIEVVGFRTSETKPGSIDVRFGVVNHSDADVGDLGLRITLRSSVAKPSDPPLCTFDVKVPSIGPNELKDVDGTCETKLRIYEFPDWQFTRSSFEITSPQDFAQ